MRAKGTLGLYLADSEGASFWLGVLTDLHHQRLQNILIASAYGLTGFPKAASTICLHTNARLCIVHRIRKSLRYVADKHHKAFMVNVKRPIRR